MLPKNTCISLIAALSVVSAAAAADVIGPTYSIVERDMLEEIEQTLRAKERTGELAKLQEAAIERSKASIERPSVHIDLPDVKKSRSFLLDPSFKVAETIRDNEGRVVAEAGTLVNPLNYVDMTTYLLFINGDDKRQVAMAAQLYGHYKAQLKVVLTKGSPLELTRQNGYQVYFDQGGALIRKLRLVAVPSLVSQEGKMLRIDEMEIQ